MTTLEVLRSARDLITPPEKWTQGANARDAKGKKCPRGSVEATCFCANGALLVVSNGSEEEYIQASNKLCRGEYSYIEYNDSHTHEEVLALFDEAIASCEAE